VLYSPPAIHWWAVNGQGLLGGEADMTGVDVRQVFEAILPHEAIDGLCMP
jgi:hypothetical protein